MYEKMKKELLEALKDMLAGTFKVKTFNAHKNGKELDAFIITEEDSCVSPTFYFKNYLDDYKKGISVQNLATEIVATYFWASQQAPAQVDINTFKDFHTQKKRIVYRVVNAEGYADQLPNIPYIEFFDLAIIFYCIVSAGEEGFMSYIITNDILKMWGISKETLYETAHQNLPKLLPLQLDSLTEILISGYSEVESLEEFIYHLPVDHMYVVTNKYHRFGFANIFYPKLLETFAKRFGSFYIIPSSVEEAMFMPVSAGMEISELKTMVKSVNETQVMPDEFLSNSIYLYDAATKKIDAYL